ncbi:MAG: HD domain-containing phosphohydrolase [Bryobacteraceae bacterium]|nr:HD domain-containing phosphohydrolase [Bryobacteraceae bacterium]
MTALTRFYIGFIIALGVCVLVINCVQWESANLFRFGTYVLLACLSGGLKIRLPGVTATLSGAFLIVLLSIAALSTPETVMIAIISAVVQYAWQSAIKLRVAQAAFNASNVAVAAWVASKVLHSPFLPGIGFEHPLSLALASLVYFAANCIIVSVVISLTDPEKRSFRQVVAEYYLWSVPFYLFGAALAEAIRLLERYAGWQTAVLVIPAVYAIYQVWAVYADRVEGERKRQEEARIHAEEMSALHLRTIHALAMAIEARDRTTHDHLRRVQIYAVEIGRAMDLEHAELEALRTASVLHDIGKLGVPEHIISKPGRLTPEEFEKVQAHPVVGAEILERVNFPYAVVPIVRCHHERWDGSGYPDGLKGEQIPIGARILSVVDCFDALASDRQYRKAMTTDQAIQVVQRAAGKDFDPKVVNLLAAKYGELESLVRSAAASEPPMLSRQEIREAVPAAGFQSVLVAGKRNFDVPSVVRTVLAAMNRSHTGQDLPAAMTAGDRQLRSTLRYRHLAVFVRESTRIRLMYLSDGSVTKETSYGTVGQGLSGWVVEEGRPILNGNGRLDVLVQANGGQSDLLCASSVPILAGDRTVGALTIYALQPDAFSARDLQVLWGLSAEIGGWLLELAALEEEPAPPEVAVTGSATHG